MPLIPAPKQPGTEPETRDHRVHWTWALHRPNSIPIPWAEEPDGLVAPTWAHSGASRLLESLSLAEGTSIEWGWVGAGPSTLLPTSAAAVRAG